jgi:hypothetical protein
METAAQQHRPERNGEGNVRLHQRKQFNNHERVIVSFYATHLMGWDKNLPRQAKQCIVCAACTLACYNLRFEKVVGQKSLENWPKKIEDSVRFTSTT